MYPRRYFDDAYKSAVNQSVREPRDIITPSPYDAPTKCVELNVTWLAHLRGMIEPMLWEDFWIGDPHDQLDMTVKASQLLQRLSMTVPCGGKNLMLRQNPADPCLLEQSFDGGSTWSLAFDYSKCLKGKGGLHVTIEEFNLVIEHIEILIQNWNTDVDLVYKQIGANDGDTNSAYCHALKVLILAILHGALARLQEGNNQELVWDAIKAGAATAAAFIFGTPLSGFLTAIGSAIVLINQAVMDQLSENELETAINNPAIIDELRCCAYLAIESQKVPEASFEAMFDGCQALTPTAASLLPILQGAVASFDVFITFLDAVNVAYDYSVAGVLANECLDCGTWEHTFNFSINDGGFATFGNPSGVYLPGIGWADSLYAPEMYRGIQKARAFAASIVTEVSMTFDFITGENLDFAGTWVGFRLLHNGVPGVNDFVDYETDGAGQVYLWQGAVLIDQVVMMAICGNNRAGDPDPGGDSLVHSLTLKGKGVNPFA